MARPRDFAFCMRDLTDIHYPNAELIRVVTGLVLGFAKISDLRTASGGDDDTSG
jgi:hypothetical protein